MSRLCLLVLISCVNYYVAGNDLQVSSNAYLKHNIIPDLLTVAPAGYLSVRHTSGAEVQEGNVLSPIDLIDIDSLSWNSIDKFYTIVMFDPDVPSRESPISRSFLHWLVVNVPGIYTEDDNQYGDTIAIYISPGPLVTTGLHRYVFLVYQQNEVLDVQELLVRFATNRTLFSIGDFAQKCNLGDPIAGNFYQAEFDTKVPNLNKVPAL